MPPGSTEPRCSSRASSTTGSTAQRTRAGLRGDAEELGVGLRRPVPDPLAAPDPLRRRLRLDMEDTRRVPSATAEPARSASPTSKSSISNGSRPRATSRQRSTRSSCTPTSRTRRWPRYDATHGIATEAWSPIAQGAVLDDPVITAIADQLGKPPAQVVLRWHIQRGNIVFPKSTTPARISENFDLFDFPLDPGHMATSTRSTAARTVAPDRTPTRSPTSQTDRRSPDIAERRRDSAAGAQSGDG